jgi:hypothetical protein
LQRLRDAPAEDTRPDAAAETDAISHGKSHADAKRSKHTPLLLIGIVAGVLAACGGGQSGVAPAKQCFGYPVPAPPTMIYPQSNATGVPDGDFTLILGFAYGNTTSLPSSSTMVGPLAPTAVPSPLPSGAATPNPNFTPVAYSVPALQSRTQYTISVQFALPNACPVTIGSFTTI